MSEPKPNPENRIALFQQKEIRRVIHDKEWWFAINDVVAALTDSANPQGYFKDMRSRDLPLADALKGGQIAPSLGLPFDTAGGKQLLQCWNTEGIFRLIQSIPSPKAEPFKRWLARIGYERIQEIEDPELATKRTRALYKAKGYSDDWIEKRMRSIPPARDELTDEWKKRGVKEQREYSILTAEISKATFGLTPTEYAEFKRLKRENLREQIDNGGYDRPHPDPLPRGEGEHSCVLGKFVHLSCTRRFCVFKFVRPGRISCVRLSRGLRKILPLLGERAGVRADVCSNPLSSGNARRELEKKSGRKVVTNENYLELTQSVKRVEKTNRGKN